MSSLRRYWWLPVVGIGIFAAALAWSRWGELHTKTVSMGTSETSSGYEVTVFSWDGSSVQFESCAYGSSTDVADLGLFRLELSDGSTIEPSASVAETYNGVCLRGQVEFVPPKGSSVGAVMFAGSPLVRWPTSA